MVGYVQCNNYTCECKDGYITYGNSGTCGYKQKEKLTAFLLSFLIGSLGADWFYLARDNGGSFLFRLLSIVLHR